MKINLIGEPKIIMNNPESLHAFFAWPSVVKLQNGNIMAGASGFRLSHMCPFGKAVVTVSDNQGESYSPLMTVIDTPLDERDAGLTTFGESGLILTSFTNEPHFQYHHELEKNAYKKAYIESLTDADIQKYVGSEFVISHDCGKTFSKIYRSPVSSPHGPTALTDGSALWVGKFVETEYTKNTWGIPELPFGAGRTAVCYSINTKHGEVEYVGRIDPPDDTENYLYCFEPHAVQLPDGTLLCHIRVHAKNARNSHGGVQEMQVFQSESYDNGKSWTTPHYLTQGSPCHLFVHSSGAVISAYGHREEPYGIRVMISFDNGKTWDKDHQIFTYLPFSDLGYPSTCELSDGSLLTIFYALDQNGTAVIWQQKWSFEK